MKEGRSKNLEDLLNIRVGPSPEQRKIELSKAQNSNLERLHRNIQEKRDQETALKETYGEDLADAAIAYSRRVGTTYGFVPYRGQQVKSDTVRPIFAAELAKGLREQPEEQQAEWVDTLFKALDQFHSPYRR